MQPAGLTALLGLLLAGSAALGTYALLVPLVVLQAVTAAGWFRLNGMWPARQGIALGFAGTLAADAAMLVSDRSPAAILGTLGVWVLLSLVLQLRSHADPDERMYGLMATVAAAALAVVAGGYLAADADAVTVGAVAVAVAVVARALPLPTPASVAVALLAAAGAGIAVGAVTDLGTPGRCSGRRGGVRADRPPGGGLRLPLPLRPLHGGRGPPAGRRGTGGVPAGPGARLNQPPSGAPAPPVTGDRQNPGAPCAPRYPRAGRPPVVGDRRR